MDFGRKLCLVLWKTWFIRKHHYLLTFCEIIIPVVIVLIATAVRYFFTPDSTSSEDIRFKPVEISYFDIPGEIVYTPVNWYTQAFASYWSDRLSQDNINVKFVGANKTDVIKDASSEKPVAAIIFDNNFPEITANALPTPFHYSLLHPIKEQEAIVLQHMIAMHLIENILGQDVESSINITTQQFPIIGQDSDFSFPYTFTVVLLLPWCFIINVISLISVLVTEEKQGIKEVASVEGLPCFLHVWGFFIVTFVIMVISTIIIVLLLCFSIYTGIPPIFQSKPWLPLSFVLVLYSLACIAFVIFISTLFNDAVRSVIFALVIWLASYVVLFEVEGRLVPAIFAALLPNTALIHSLFIIMIMEQTDGFSAQYIIKPPSTALDLILLPVLFMLVFDSVLYMFLAWYVKQIYPGSHGVPKPFYFFFTKRYWAAIRQHSNKPNYGIASSASDLEEPVNKSRWEKIKSVIPLPGPKESYFLGSESLKLEKDPKHLELVISMNDMSKVFTSWCYPPVYAVRNVSLNIYRTQLFVFVGETGSGKTTLARLLTGMHKATLGTVFVRDFDMKTHTAQAREGIGFCPQRITLFPDLTVNQHLAFFGKLNGIAPEHLGDEINYFLNQLNLSDQKDIRASRLFTGEQRRLQLGMALIGINNVAILDEPSLGLDEEQTSEIWNFLLHLRDRCCIVVMTKSMVEAHALGDRIAVLVRGRIVCCGSPSFLENIFGSGYNLKVVKSAGCSTIDVFRFVRARVPDAVIGNEVRSEINFVLPNYRSTVFPELCRDMEKRSNELKIGTLTLASSSLEEITFRADQLFEDSTEKFTADDKGDTRRMWTSVNEYFLPNWSLNKHPEGKSSRQASDHAWIYTGKARDNAGDQNYSKRTVKLQMFYGLLLKRAYYAFHRFYYFFFQLTLLTTCAVLAIVLLKSDMSALSPFATRATRFPDTGSDTILVQHEGSDEQLIALEERYRSQFPSGTNVLNVEDIEDELIGIGKSDMFSYVNKHHIAASFAIFDGENVYFNAFHHGTSYEIRAAALNMIHCAILREYTDENLWKIELDFVELDREFSEKEAEEFSLQNNSFLQSTFAAAFITLGVILFVSSFVILVIKERITESKHLQLTTGPGIILFWLSAFLWDFLFYCIGIVCFVIVIVIIGQGTPLATGRSPGILLFILLLFGWCVLSSMYVVSLFCRNSLATYCSLVLIHMLTAIVFGLIHGSLTDYSLDLHGEVTLETHVFHRVLEVFPACALVVATTKLMYWAEGLAGGGSYFEFSTNGGGHQLLMLFLVGVIFVVVLLFLELRLPHYLRLYIERRTAGNGGSRKPIFDGDLAREANRVHKFVQYLQFHEDHLTGKQLDEAEETVILVDGVSKTYFRNKNVVRYVTFGVKRGECFGLLGVEGAGKSTTLKLLNGQISLSTGTVYINDVGLHKTRTEYMKRIGYCPQFSGLLLHMSGQETLLMYARLRGIKNSRIQKVVADMIQAFGLSEFARTLVSKYSDATRRQLSLAIAFIGLPEVVILDEPTFGLDAAARQKIWDAILAFKDYGATIIVATKSTEECEVLCTRVSILVNGAQKCLWPVQALRKHYGHGFQVIINLKTTGDKKEQTSHHKEVIRFIKGRFKGSHIEIESEVVVQFSVSSESAEWRTLFGELEAGKHNFGFRDYTITGCTLHEAFIADATMNSVENSDEEESINSSV